MENLQIHFLHTKDRVNNNIGSFHLVSLMLYYVSIGLIDHLHWMWKRKHTKAPPPTKQELHDALVPTTVTTRENVYIAT